MKKKLNILHLHSGIGDSGGIANYISNLLQAKTPSLFNIFVTCSKKKSNQVKNSGLFDESKLLFIDLDRYNIFSLFLNFFRLNKLVRNNSIDLIHAHALRSGLLACLNKILFSKIYIYTNHGLRFTQKKTIPKKVIFYLYETLVITFSNYTCCIRKIDYQKLLDSPFNIFFKHKLKLVKTKLKMPKYCFLKKQSKRLKIVGIGSLIKVKRPFLFLEIIVELYKVNKNIDAIWIGDGELKNSIIEKSNNLNVPIKWLGHLSKNDLQRYLGESYLTLLTSEFEVFPLSIIESYWSGLPVISLDFFGVNEFIKDKKTGLILPATSTPHFIAHKINNFLNNKLKSNKMNNYITNYYWNNLYDDGKSYDLYFVLYKLISKKHF